MENPAAKQPSPREIINSHVNVARGHWREAGRRLLSRGDTLLPSWMGLPGWTTMVVCAGFGVGISAVGVTTLSREHAGEPFPRRCGQEAAAVLSRVNDLTTVKGLKGDQLMGALRTDPAMISFKACRDAQPTS